MVLDQKNHSRRLLFVFACIGLLSGLESRSLTEDNNGLYTLEIMKKKEVAT